MSIINQMPIQHSPQQRFPEVRIVEASAGSGKTYALAKRYIELLFLAPAPDGSLPLKHILAITFSNKAAVEMKERILLFLKRMALGRFEGLQEKEALLAGLGLSEEEAGRRSFAAMDQIVRNYNFFQVQTIDSFINAILSGCAFRLGLSAHFRIKTECTDYLAYGLDALIDRAPQDRRVREAFLDFLHQYLHLEKRSGWFPKKDILEVAIDLFGKTNRYGGEFVVPAGSLDDAARVKKDVLSDIRALYRDLPEGTHAMFARKLGEFLSRPRSSFLVAELSGFFAREDFPARKDERIPAGIRKLWHKIREGIRLAAEAEAMLVFGSYVAIFRMVLRDCRDVCVKEDILFLEELNRQAHLLFGEKKLDIPELYYRLSLRLKHYLIDEFQDTSPLQWKNMSGMVREALSVGGSLFYVGDKKQAIYRFRGGDVSVFDAAADQLSMFPLHREFLRHNFRSCRQIVLFTNGVFGAQNLRRFLEGLRGDGKDSFNMGPAAEEAVIRVFEGAGQEPVGGRGGGYVRLYQMEASSQEEKNESVRQKLMTLLGDLTKRYARADIAILVRKNDDVEMVSEWLITAEIPVESEKTLDIRNNALIKELVSFLRFLQSPIDNLSFVSFVLGGIFQAASGLSGEALHDFVFCLRADRDRREEVYFYREFRRRFPSIWAEFMEEFFRNVGYVPLYELAVSILRKFRCLEVFGDQQAFFMRFLELIKEAEEDHGPLASFLDFFADAQTEAFYVRPPKTDAVKVLTVHKAKGLGFQVVVLPFLEMTVEVPAVLTSVADDRMDLVRVTEKSRRFSPILERIFAQEYHRCFIDELDNMYVAMTRARQELYIFVPRVGRRSNLAVSLVGDQDIEAGAPAASSSGTPAPKIDLSEEIPAASYQDWIGFLKGEFGDSGLIRRREALLKGEVMHHILAHLGDMNGREPREALEAAAARARTAYPSFAFLDECLRLAGRLVAAAACRPIFYPQGKDVYVEKELIDRRGRSRRLDRLLTGPEECWVVDYKMSREERDRGEEQVREYMELVADIFNGRRVRGFLVFCDTARLEEIL